jgi:DUF1680 family protein
MFELLNSLQSSVQKTGRIDLADWIEVLAFNSASGARLTDGSAIQYLTRDNQLEATRAAGCEGRFKLSPTHEEVAVCCAANAIKFFTYFTNHLWMRENTGLVAVAYAPNVIETTVNGVRVTVETETAADDVRLTIHPVQPVRFSLRLRIPGWESNEGWRVITQEWKAGDTVKLSFAPKVVRKTAGNGEVYWQRGPLVYALPIPSQRNPTKQYSVPGFADWDYTPTGDAFWDYAADAASDDFTFEPTGLSGTLFNLVSKQTERVRLQPMGTSLLRRVTFRQQP